MRTDVAATILDAAGVKHATFWASGELSVYVSDANQLFAEKRVFDSRQFRKNEAYAAWEAHHVVEAQDLQRLGVAFKLPRYDEQTCVLLPAGGHRGRINARLRALLPIGASIDESAVIEAYGDAYEMLGDYCGGGEGGITQELMAIVRATLRQSGFSV